MCDSLTEQHPARIEAGGDREGGGLRGRMGGRTMKKREKGKGRNVPNEKKRRNVVAVILDRYEEHSSDWKKYGDEGAAGRRSVFVEQELYDEIGRQELIA